MERRRLGKHEDDDCAYLSTVLLPLGESAAALTISAHCVEIFAIQRFVREPSPGELSSESMPLPHEV